MKIILAHKHLKKIFSGCHKNEDFKVARRAKKIGFNQIKSIYLVGDENKLKLLIMKFECRDVTLTWKFQVRIEMFSVLNILKARKSRVVYNE